jgi:hypothetical protein
MAITAACAVLSAFHQWGVRVGRRTMRHVKRKLRRTAWLDQAKMLGGVPPLPVKMRSNLEEPRGQML